MVPLVIIILLLLTSTIKVVREYERLVVFRLGHIIGARGPGLVIIIPFIDRVIRYRYGLLPWMCLPRRLSLGITLLPA